MSRPLTWLITGGLLALAVAAAIDALHSSASEPARRSPILAPSAPSASTDTQTWARTVAVAAGYEVVGTTRSALVLRRPGASWHDNFYFWVTRRDPPAANAAPASAFGNEEFPAASRVGTVTVFGDGVRFAWPLSRGTAWAEAAGDRPLKIPTLRSLVVASTHPVPTAAPRERLPTCTAPQLGLAIELLGGSATVALRHVSGSSCHLRRLQ